MGKNILVITGSPRKGGNSIAMTDAFIKAAEEKGHTVARIDAASLSVAGCRACYQCYKTGKPCAIDDDFNKIAPAFEAADTLIFTMPIYWYSFPAQIKAVLDRMFALGMGQRNISGKQYALIACCEEQDMTVFDGVTIPLKHAEKLLKWQCIGNVLIPGVNDIGDIHKTDGCAQAAALAAQL